MLTILYFARLRERVGLAQESIALPAGIVDVGGLLDLLVQRHPGLAQTAEAGFVLRAAVNQQMANLQSAVQDGDEVAFFPPVTGG